MIALAIDANPNQGCAANASGEDAYFAFPPSNPPEAQLTAALGSVTHLEREFLNSGRSGTTLQSRRIPGKLSTSFNVSGRDVLTAPKLSTSFNAETTIRILIGRKILKPPSTRERASMIALAFDANPNQGCAANASGENVFSAFRPSNPPEAQLTASLGDAPHIPLQEQTYDQS